MHKFASISDGAMPALGHVWPPADHAVLSLAISTDSGRKYNKVERSLLSVADPSRRPSDGGYRITATVGNRQRCTLDARSHKSAPQNSSAPRAPPTMSGTRGIALAIRARSPVAAICPTPHRFGLPLWLTLTHPSHDTTPRLGRLRRYVGILRVSPVVRNARDDPPI
jgi:hypothetical protein